MEALREKALAKLSIAALAIDLLFVLVLWRLGQDLLPKGGGGLLAIIRTWYLAAIPVILVLHLFVVEVVLAGWSIGRFCCGLTVSHRNLAASTIGWRVKRFLTILTRFGLGSLNPSQLPGYNCADDLTFTSDLAGAAPTRSRSNSAPRRAAPSRPMPAGSSPRIAARLVVDAGPHKGMTADMAASLARTGVFRIGRDPAWADLVLDKDTQISTRHCHITLANGRLSISDGDGTGRGSTNGTAVDGRPLAGAGSVLLPGNATITVGGSRIKVS